MPTVGDLFRVVIPFTITAVGKAANVLAFEVIDGTCTDAELLAGAELWIESVYSEWLGLVRNTMSHDEATCWEMTYSAPDWEVSRIVGYFTPDVTYTEIAENVPIGIAALVTTKTIKPRTFGRLFLAGLSIDQVDADVLNATTLTDLAAGAAELIASFSVGTATARYCVLAKGGLWFTASAAISNELVAYQRRRKPGVGI